MSIKVEKCPFCGRAVEAVNGLDYKPDRHGIRPSNLVRCHHCGYTSPSAKDVETAIRKHNRLCQAARRGTAGQGLVKRIEHSVYDFVVRAYGASEAREPSWATPDLARYVATDLSNPDYKPVNKLEYVWEDI